MADFAEIRKLEKQAEYGKWKNWYRGEWLDGIDETHKMVQDYLAWLDDPLKVPQPTIVNSWQGYYHIMHYEGTKSTDVK
jgi:asparagine N-glycosylation enzyme membrane subunit Stt3